MPAGSSADGSRGASPGRVAVRAGSLTGGAKVSASPGACGPPSPSIFGPGCTARSITPRRLRERGDRPRYEDLSDGPPGAQTQPTRRHAGSRDLDSPTGSLTFVGMSAPDRSWTIAPTLVWFGLAVTTCMY